MSVNNYVNDLLGGVDDLLSSAPNVCIPPFASRLIGLHQDVQSTIRSENITPEQRSQLKAAKRRLIVEGFKIDIDNQQEDTDE